MHCSSSSLLGDLFGNHTGPAIVPQYYRVSQTGAANHRKWVVLRTATIPDASLYAAEQRLGAMNVAWDLVASQITATGVAAILGPGFRYDAGSPY